jgi:fumarate reductase subunit D
MTRSHKPIVWSLFAAGGTYAAFFAPALILVTGLAVTLGLLPADALSYERILGFARHPIGKAFLFFTVFLLAWHSAHRLRITAHDFGLRADGLVMAACYGLAALGSVVAAVALLRM